MELTDGDIIRIADEILTDTARMDWLETHRGIEVDCYMANGNLTYILRRPWGAPLGHGPTVRAAIDNARGATPTYGVNPSDGGPKK